MENYKGYAALLATLDNRMTKVYNHKHGIGASMIGHVRADHSLTLHWAGLDNALKPSEYFVCEGLLENECTAPPTCGEVKTKRRYLPEGNYLVIAVDNNIVCVVDRLVKASEV